MREGSRRKRVRNARESREKEGRIEAGENEGRKQEKERNGEVH